MAEAQAGIKMLDQGEDIILGRGLRIPPAMVRDDQHLTFLAPAFTPSDAEKAAEAAQEAHYRTTKKKEGRSENARFDDAAGSEL